MQYTYIYICIHVYTYTQTHTHTHTHTHRGHSGVKDTLGAPKAHHVSDVPHDIAREAPPLSMHDAVDGVVHHSHSPHLDASSDPGYRERDDGGGVAET